jgi:hypothetical protein
VDKYEYTVKTEKIKKLAEKRDYAAAAKIADTIDWSRVQDIRSLSLAADVYERSRRYSEAKDMLCLAYELVPAGRRMLYRLTELSIKEGNLEEAEDFFREYQETAPEDEGKFILRYKMAVAKGESLEKQIAILEAYRKREFDEKWAFELASLYSKAGNSRACVRLCDEIILWFGFGKYVDKAMDLKQNYEPLTPGQAEKAEHRREYEARMKAVAQEYDRAAEEEPQESDEAAATKETEPDESFYEMPREEEAFYETDRYETEETAQPETIYPENARTEENPMEEILARALLTADQFDEDGFALDLGTERARKPAPEPAFEETRELKELKDLREEEMIPQIDLDCVREAAAEAETDTGKKAEEEDDGWDSPLGRGIQMNLEDVLREMGIVPEAGKVETLTTEEILGEPDLSEEPELSEETTEEPDPTEAPEEDAWMPSPEMFEPEPEPELEPEPEEEELEEYAPVFACILMEANDLTKAVPQAVDLIKKKHNLLGTMASQAAKISGVKLNKKGMKSSLDRLNGRDLIVEGAGMLERSLLLELAEELRHPSIDGVVVLTDEPEGLHELIQRCPEIVDVSDYVEDETNPPAPAAKQIEQVQKGLDAKARAEEELRRLMEERARAEAERKEKEKAEAAARAKAAQEEAAAAEEPAPEIPAEENLEKTIRETEKEASRGRTLTMKEFAKYIEDYAYEMECVLDDKAGLAIYARAEHLLEEGEELTEENARELADDAIYLAEKPSLRGVFSGKYDKNGYLILKEHHFSE